MDEGGGCFPSFLCFLPVFLRCGRPFRIDAAISVLFGRGGRNALWLRAVCGRPELLLLFACGLLRVLRCNVIGQPVWPAQPDQTQPQTSSLFLPFSPPPIRSVYHSFTPRQKTSAATTASASAHLTTPHELAQGLFGGFHQHPSPLLPTPYKQANTVCFAWSLRYKVAVRVEAAQRRFELLIGPQSRKRRRRRMRMGFLFLFSELASKHYGDRDSAKNPQLGTLACRFAVSSNPCVHKVYPLRQSCCSWTTEAHTQQRTRARVKRAKYACSQRRGVRTRKFVHPGGGGGVGLARERGVLTVPRVTWVDAAQCKMGDISLGGFSTMHFFPLPHTRDPSSDGRKMQRRQEKFPAFSSE